VANSIQEPGGVMSVLRTPFLRELFLGACGLASSVLTAILLAYAELAWDFPLYSYMVLFLIPLGAIAAGAVGAAGYYFGARLVGAPPGRIAVGSIVVASLATFFLLHYSEYRWLEVDGRRVRDLVTFPRYLDHRIQATSMEIDVHGRKGQTDRLDELGYVVAGLQLVGFAVGGLIVFGYLRKVPYCRRCSLFVVRSSLAQRSTSNPSVLSEGYDRVRDQLDLGALDGVVREHATMGANGWVKGNENRSTLEVRACPSCTNRWVQLTTQKRVFGELQTSRLSTFLEAPGQTA
jgi:hypothetical protein